MAAKWETFSFTTRLRISSSGTTRPSISIWAVRPSSRGEKLKKIRKGLRAARRIPDGEPRLAVAAQVVTAENAEAHGEAMVAVGLDRLAGAQRLRVDFQRIVRLDHALPEPGELARHAS